MKFLVDTSCSFRVKPRTRDGLTYIRGHTNGRADGRTDTASTICSAFINNIIMLLINCIHIGLVIGLKTEMNSLSESHADLILPSDWLNPILA